MTLFLIYHNCLRVGLYWFHIFIWNIKTSFGQHSTANASQIHHSFDCRKVKALIFYSQKETAIRKGTISIGCPSICVISYGNFILGGKWNLTKCLLKFYFILFFPINTDEKLDSPTSVELPARVHKQTTKQKQKKPPKTI